MSVRRRNLTRVRAAAGGLLLAGLLAGCGSSVGLGLTPNDSGTGATSGYGAGSAKSTKVTAGSSAATAGMTMDMSGSTSVNASGSSVTSTTVPEVNGIKPVASQALATADWQGMKIEAMTTTPTTFLIDDGTSAKGVAQYSEVKANKHESFHLMVMLTDQYTGVQIPYATVWATIYNAKGKMVYTDRQWPMISAYMGSHYGDNVTLPGPGRYRLKLLISPPAAARHLEYAHVWKTDHDVTASFSWKPVT